MAYVECEVIDEGGRLVGKFSSTCLIIALPEESGENRVTA